MPALRWALALLLLGGFGAALAQPAPPASSAVSGAAAGGLATGPARAAGRIAPEAEPGSQPRTQPRSQSGTEPFWRIRMRVGNSRPKRQEQPLRGANISDEEVRQIEQATRALAPGALVNIGPVTTGCPCEDGPDCSDRVWVVAYSPAYSQGLMLSRLAGRWQLGALQAWWLEHDALHGRPFPPPAASPQPDAAPVYPRHDALQQLWEAYPECPAAG